MAILIDTSFLLALVFASDMNHSVVRRAMREIREERIIPAPVLPEFFYMCATRMNYTAAINAFVLVQSDLFSIETLTRVDMPRMQQIMEKYADNKFDFVDTSLMALSERPGIEDIYTLDQRDFRVFRPKHCPYLRIFP